MLINLNYYLKKEFPKEKLKKAHEKKYIFLHKFCDNINKDYLKELCEDSNNKIFLYIINNTLTSNYKNEIIGILVYRIILSTSDKTRIYIKLISVKKNMRSYGYGAIILDEFIDKVKYKNIELVLLSLETSFDFYSKMGFQKTSVKYIEKNEHIGNSIMMSKFIIKM